MRPHAMLVLRRARGPMLPRGPMRARVLMLAHVPTPSRVHMPAHVPAASRVPRGSPPGPGISHGQPPASGMSHDRRQRWCRASCTMCLVRPAGAYRSHVPGCRPGRAGNTRASPRGSPAFDTAAMRAGDRACRGGPMRAGAQACRGQSPPAGSRAWQVRVAPGGRPARHARVMRRRLRVRPDRRSRGGGPSPAAGVCPSLPPGARRSPACYGN